MSCGYRRDNGQRQDDASMPLEQVDKYRRETKKMSCVTRSPIFQYANIFLYLCTTVKISFSPINLCFAFLDQMVLHKKMLINLMNISVSIQMITFHVVDGQEIMVLVVCNKFTRL